ncbi:MAG TPA: sigma-70 family RNA polymerase sigma factor [Bacteroidales bacterium]|nr:sigma-70 family RNA polymerase sigma factor [Bacteroidales bacterium]
MKEALNVETRSDMEVIKDILEGNSAQFEILIRRNNSVLYKLGRSFGFGHEDTEDLMQETFLNAYAGLEKFQGRAAFRTWLVRIMISNCHAKRNKSGYLYEKAGGINESSVPMYMSSNTETNMIVMNNELGSVIENALAKVPMEYRMVFSLREISGFNVSETAEALNISETNVRARLSRAKAMLRKEVEKSYAPEEIFEFNLIWCDRMVERVMRKINS